MLAALASISSRSVLLLLVRPVLLLALVARACGSGSAAVIAASRRILPRRDSSSSMCSILLAGHSVCVAFSCGSPCCCTALLLLRLLSSWRAMFMPVLRSISALLPLMLLLLLAMRVIMLLILLMLVVCRAWWVVLLVLLLLVVLQGSWVVLVVWRRHVSRQLLLLQVELLLLGRAALGLLLLMLCLQLLQCKGFLKLLRCADTQHLYPVHGTDLFVAVVGVKQQQQVAHAAALRQRECLSAALVLGCKAAQQLPCAGGQARCQVRTVLARVAGAAQYPKGVNPAAVQLLHSELHGFDSSQLHEQQQGRTQREQKPTHGTVRKKSETQRAQRGVCAVPMSAGRGGSKSRIHLTGHDLLSTPADANLCSADTRSVQHTPGVMCCTTHL